MDDGSHNLNVRRLKLVLLLTSLVSMVVLLLAAFQENLAGEWRRHQEDYRAMQIRNAPTEQARAAARQIEIGFQQLFLPGLSRIDRCVTCHVGVDDPTLAAAPQPLRTHSGNLLAHHPVDRFGCTVCHGGQGRAIDRAEAHGEVEHWPAPLLRGEAVYTSCGQCHYENDLFGASFDLFAQGGDKADVLPLSAAELHASVPGAKGPDQRAIGRGKQLVLSSGCLGCHEFRGRGGKLGPDITHVGDKTAHDFDFEHVRGPHTVASWLFEHFKRPAEVVPGTLMPEMGLTDSGAHDLAQYMLSLHRKQMPAAYTPVPPRRRDADEVVSGEQLFAMFCSACHGRQGQGGTVLDPELMMLAEPPRQLLTPALNNVDTLAVASDDYLRYIIRNGRHGTNMIAWSAQYGGMTDGEIDRLVAYIRHWAGPGADLSRVAASRGDSRRGAALYRLRCQGCHGRGGTGGIGPSLSSPSFLAVASDAFMARAIVHGRANTAMPAWKHLNADEVSDLIAYVRSWQRPPADKATVLARLSAEPSPGARAQRIGQTLFRGNCGNCHGLNGEGGIGPSLNHEAFLSLVDDEYLYDAIVHGRPGTAMPSWQHLSADDLVDVINHLRSWNGRQRKPLEPFVARGDWDRGERLYSTMCAGCHGASGEGATGSQLNNPVFLASASDAMLRHWVRYGKSGTEMRAFLKGEQGLVELSDAQIEDVVTYVRRFQSDRPLVTSRPGIGIPYHGEQVYNAACVQCHGRDGQGVTGSALSNPDFLRAASDGFLQATIVLGRDGTEMRPMGKGALSNVELNSEDIRNLVAYIRLWELLPPQRPASNVPQRFVIGADLNEGRTLFAGYCAGCHGTHGNDGWAPSLNNRDFLMAASDGFLQATIARGRSSTPMRPFARGAEGVAELSTQQINSIVAFVRSWAPDGYKPIPGPGQQLTGHTGAAVNANVNANANANALVNANANPTENAKR